MYDSEDIPIKPLGEWLSELLQQPDLSSCYHFHLPWASLHFQPYASSSRSHEPPSSSIRICLPSIKNPFHSKNLPHSPETFIIVFILHQPPFTLNNYLLLYKFSFLLRFTIIWHLNWMQYLHDEDKKIWISKWMGKINPINLVACFVVSLIVQSNPVQNYFLDSSIAFDNWIA